MFNRLRQFVRGSSPARKRAGSSGHPHRFRPQMEMLEDRITPSSDNIIAVGTGGGVAAQVKVYSLTGGTNGNLLFTLNPYPGFTGAVRVATGDVNNDSTDDIITGAGPGGQAHIKVFSGVDGSEIASFIAFNGFMGGVFVAAGNFDGDANKEIVVGADAGADPHVSIFNQNGTQATTTAAGLANFDAFAAGFTGGVRVAAGDIDGVAGDELVVGAGPGGGTHVKAYDRTTGAEIASFFAFPGFNGGVYVAAGDPDDTGTPNNNIIVGAGEGGPPHVKFFTAAGVLQNSFIVNGLAASSGVRVSAPPDAYDQGSSSNADLAVAGASNANGTFGFVDPNDTTSLDNFFVFAFPGATSGLFIG